MHSPLFRIIVHRAADIAISHLTKAVNNQAVTGFRIRGFARGINKKILYLAYVVLRQMASVFLKNNFKTNLNVIVDLSLINISDTTRHLRI